METRSKKIKTSNDDKLVKLDLNGELIRGKTNPLQIPEITDHMFQFLKLSDNKNCRSVCRKWNHLTEKFLKKLSVVEISEPERVEEFNQMFSSAQQSPIFACFRFDPFQWSDYKFVAFFEKWHHNLTELTLIKPRFVLDEDDEESMPYDLSPLLPPTLIKLRITGVNPRMIISIDKICNIRILKLDGCILIIVPGTTLNNVEIDLRRVKFWENQETMENILINTLLNFDVLKKATFCGKNLTVDFKGSYSMESLSLMFGVAVLNWKTSNWKIKKLFHGLYPYKEMKEDPFKSQIQYNKLEIIPTNLNVSCLPECIVKLQLSFYRSYGESCPRIYGEHNFPNLNHVNITLNHRNDFSPFVEFFKPCPKLTTLTVQCQLGGSIFKTSSIPLSVKTVRVISGVQIIVDRSFQLESLILYNVHLGRRNNNIVDVVKELHVKNLIWVGLNRESPYRSYENIFSNKKGHNFKSVIDLHLDNFVVGDFSLVDDSTFEKSIFFPLVDTQGIYYLFQRGEKGKALTSDSKLDYKTLTKMLKRWMTALK